MDPCFQAKDPEPQFSQLCNQRSNPVLPIFEIRYFVSVALCRGRSRKCVGKGWGFGLQMMETMGCHGKTGEWGEEPRLPLA